MSASLLARAGPAPPSSLGGATQTDHHIKARPQVREEGGDPWLKSQSWRKTQLCLQLEHSRYSPHHTVLVQLQPPSSAVLTA